VQCYRVFTRGDCRSDLGIDQMSGICQGKIMSGKTVHGLPHVRGYVSVGLFLLRIAILE